MVSNSGCSCVRAFFLFLKFIFFLKLFRSRKSSQLLPNAWISRVTLKPKVTSWSTWLLLFLLVFVSVRPTTMNFCLIRQVFRSRNSFQLLPIAWSSRVTWQTEDHVMVYATFLRHVDHDVTLSFKIIPKSTASGNSYNEFFDLKSLRSNKQIIAVGNIQARHGVKTRSHRKSRRSSTILCRKHIQEKSRKEFWLLVEMSE